MAEGTEKDIIGDTTASSTRLKEFRNHLAKEKSPYLLQHASNPVEWYPWGEEAIERARRENKVIFLSVGYSTCHWCHVMAHESFEDEKVAAIMNKHFINIKVDREERPDIDRLYMQFIIMMTGNGGWPMSVWLTPDLNPFTAGTYFPPQDQWRMPSFTKVLETIATQWQINEADLRSNSHDVINAIRDSINERHVTNEYNTSHSETLLRETLQVYKKRYDREHGGFGIHPKFPEVSRLNLLLHMGHALKNQEPIQMALHTLDCIGRGGIHDHVFDGFSRYSVDENWHVPHFEKMLYDQGQLMTVYSSAYKMTGDQKYLEYANGILRYVCTSLQHSLGGFYAGEDADSLPQHGDTAKVEGAFYAWSLDEIKLHLLANKDKFSGLGLRDDQNLIDIYSYHYGLLPDGNVPPTSDPHMNFLHKNILIVGGSLQQTCDKFGLELDKLKQLLTTANDILYEERKKRPPPHLDTKIICSWNSLLLSGLSKLAACDGPQRVKALEAAQKLVKFIRSHLYDKEKRLLRRVCYGLDRKDPTVEQNEGNEMSPGFLDDYAFLIKGLLDYYSVSLDFESLTWAKELQDIQDSLFWDEEMGAYYYSQANTPNVIVRLKDDHDGAEPSGNSVVSSNLFLLSHYFDEPSYLSRVERMFAHFSDQKPFGHSLPEMLSSLVTHANGLNLVLVLPAGNRELNEKMALLCHQFYIPAMLIFESNDLSNCVHIQRLQQKHKPIDNKPTAYLCRDKVCQLPITDPERLEFALKETFRMTTTTCE